MFSFLQRIRLYLLLLPLLASCVSQKQLPYFQDKNFSTKNPVSVTNESPTYRLQPNDVLSVRVQSVQPALNDMFNVMGGGMMFGGDPGSIFLTGYNIEEGGVVNLPTVGKVKVSGLTVDQAQALIQKEVARYIRDANVLVKLLSFKVTVLGEVRNPGRYFVYNGQTTILETLGLAGDLTEFANRQNVKLIRPTSKGNQVILLDLTDPKLLSSPYFFLLPNDALYVEPLAARTNRGNAASLGIIFGGISALALVANIVFNITRNN